MSSPLKRSIDLQLSLLVFSISLLLSDPPSNALYDHLNEVNDGRLRAYPRHGGGVCNALLVTR